MPSAANTGFTVKVLLHAGIDKAGSTAIQSHLYANREWLAKKRVYLPETGLTRYGHRKLFPPELAAGPWKALSDELNLAARSGFDRAVLSFEGIATLPPGKVDQLSHHLADFNPALLFYLRDQAAVLQSGYLQNLKAGPQTLTVDQLREDPRRLPLESRDYLRMLAPFRSTFGDTNIFVRPFVGELLENGDVVDDFLSALQLLVDTDFERLSMRQNLSLDLPSARLLNALDQRGSQENRDALVDDLLWIIRRDGPGERWFLDREAVAMLREHYRSSNAQLLREFALPLNEKVFFGLNSEPWRSGETDDCEKLASALERLRQWPRWNGSRCAGASLAAMLEGGGWQVAPDSGQWTCGRVGVIRFRVPLSRYAQKPRDLLLRIRGDYPHGKGTTRAILNGRPRGNGSISPLEISVKASELGRERQFELQLEHMVDVSSGEGCFRLESMELIRV
jgi:hypothetical protein